MTASLKIRALTPRRPAKPRVPGKNAHPEADLQRAVVAALYAALPHNAIVHCSANEVRAGGAKGRRDQGLAVGMGVYAGFSDLMVIVGGRVLFLELKSKTGSLSPAQRAFRDRVCAQGFPWALVRSIDDALQALRDHNLPSRARTIR